MKLKQPRVPEMLPGMRLTDYIRNLILFLKDYCMGVWTELRNINDRLDKIEKGVK